MSRKFASLSADAVGRSPPVRGVVVKEEMIVNGGNGSEAHATSAGAVKERPHAQAKLLSPTEKCRVCHEPAAKHIHYGANTCFSCRAFFRRSIQNKTASTYSCRRNKSCEINLKTRKNCQYCRYQKCLNVGMKPSWVLTEEERERRFRKSREKAASTQYRPEMQLRTRNEGSFSEETYEVHSPSEEFIGFSEQNDVSPEASISSSSQLKQEGEQFFAEDDSINMDESCDNVAQLEPQNGLGSPIDGVSATTQNTKVIINPRIQVSPPASVVSQQHHLITTTIPLSNGPVILTPASTCMPPTSSTAVLAVANTTGITVPRGGQYQQHRVMVSPSSTGSTPASPCMLSPPAPPPPPVTSFQSVVMESGDGSVKHEPRSYSISPPSYELPQLKDEALKAGLPSLNLNGGRPSMSAPIQVNPITTTIPTGSLLQVKQGFLAPMNGGNSSVTSVIVNTQQQRLIKEQNNKRNNFNLRLDPSNNAHQTKKGSDPVSGRSQVDLLDMDTSDFPNLQLMVDMIHNNPRAIQDAGLLVIGQNNHLNNTTIFNSTQHEHGKSDTNRGLLLSPDLQTSRSSTIVMRDRVTLGDRTVPTAIDIHRQDVITGSMNPSTFNTLIEVAPHFEDLRGHHQPHYTEAFTASEGCSSQDLLPNDFVEASMLVDDDSLSSPELEPEEIYNTDDEEASYNRQITFRREPEVKFSKEELDSLTLLVEEHNERYSSVNFGESLIKEMFMCSLFGIPVTYTAAIDGYRLIVERITRIANSNSVFKNLSKEDQTALLKENADMLVCLRGAIFFDSRKQGKEQILISMGKDDMGILRNLFSKLLNNSAQLNHIDYKTFNSIQTVGDNPEEDRYNYLQEKIGRTLYDDKVAIMLTFIILFSTDFVTISQGKLLQKTQEEFVYILQRYIYSIHPRDTACLVLANNLEVITGLREMADIKKKRNIQAKVRLPGHLQAS